MTIQFIFVLKRLIPEVRGFSKNEIESLVESARQSSIPRIRKYSGYSFAVSFFVPPVLFASVFIKLGLIPGGTSFIFVGMIGLLSALSVLSTCLLTSIFNTMILKPAIYEQLNKRPRPPNAIRLINPAIAGVNRRSQRRMRPGPKHFLCPCW